MRLASIGSERNFVMTSKKKPFLNGVQPESDDSHLGSLLKNFLVDAFLSGLPIFVYLLLSMEMTHSTLAQVGGVKLAVSLAVPVICGVLAAVFKQRFAGFLAAIFDSVPPLPF